MSGSRSSRRAQSRSSSLSSSESEGHPHLRQEYNPGRSHSHGLHDHSGYTDIELQALPSDYEPAQRRLSGATVFGDDGPSLQPGGNDAALPAPAPTRPRRPRSSRGAHVFRRHPHSSGSDEEELLGDTRRPPPPLEPHVAGRSEPAAPHARPHRSTSEHQSREERNSRSCCRSCWVRHYRKSEPLFPPLTVRSSCQNSGGWIEPVGTVVFLILASLSNPRLMS